MSQHVLIYSATVIVYHGNQSFAQNALCPNTNQLKLTTVWWCSPSAAPMHTQHTNNIPFRSHEQQHADQSDLTRTFHANQTIAAVRAVSTLLHGTVCGNCVSLFISRIIKLPSLFRLHQQLPFGRSESTQHAAVPTSSHRASCGWYWWNEMGSGQTHTHTHSASCTRIDFDVRLQICAQFGAACYFHWLKVCWFLVYILFFVRKLTSMLFAI